MATPTPEQVARAADAATPQAELAELAYEFPELRETVAKNPSAYDGLRDWIADNNSPTLVDVAANEARALTGESVAVTPNAASTLFHQPGAVRPVDPKGSSLRGYLFSGIAAFLVIVLAALGAVLIYSTRLGQAKTLYSAGSHERSGQDGPTANPSATEATPTPESSATALSNSPVPSSCEGLLGDAMVADLTGHAMELNPTWTDTQPPKTGSNDEVLLSLLSQTRPLNCYWVSTDAGASAAILTAITYVTADQSAAAMTRASSLKYARRDQYGGVRFFFEKTDANGRKYGESQFFRGNLWFATRWYGYGALGYTEDLAAHVAPA